MNNNKQYLFQNPRNIGSVGDVSNDAPALYERVQTVLSEDKYYQFLILMAGNLHEPVTTLLQGSAREESQSTNNKIYQDIVKAKIDVHKILAEKIIEVALKNGTPVSEGDGDNSRLNIRTTDEFDLYKERIENIITASPLINSPEAISRLLREVKDSLPTTTFDITKLFELLQSGFENFEGNSFPDSIKHFEKSFKVQFSPLKTAFIMMTNQAHAAIISSYELLTIELKKSYGAENLDAQKIIESENLSLKTSFAELCAYKYANARMFQSSSAIYVGIQPARVNMKMLQLSLKKCAKRVLESNWT